MDAPEESKSSVKPSRVPLMDPPLFERPSLDLCRRFSGFFDEDGAAMQSLISHDRMRTKLHSLLSNRVTYIGDVTSPVIFENNKEIMRVLETYLGGWLQLVDHVLQNKQTRYGLLAGKEMFYIWSGSPSLRTFPCVAEKQGGDKHATRQKDTSIVFETIMLCNLAAIMYLNLGTMAEQMLDFVTADRCASNAMICVWVAYKYRSQTRWLPIAFSALPETELSVLVGMYFWCQSRKLHAETYIIQSRVTEKVDWSHYSLLCNLHHGAHVLATHALNGIAIDGDIFATNKFALAIQVMRTESFVETLRLKSEYCYRASNRDPKQTNASENARRAQKDIAYGFLCYAIILICRVYEENQKEIGDRYMASIQARWHPVENHLKGCMQDIKQAHGPGMRFDYNAINLNPIPLLKEHLKTKPYKFKEADLEILCIDFLQQLGVFAAPDNGSDNTGGNCFVPVRLSSFLVSQSDDEYETEEIPEEQEMTPEQPVWEDEERQEEHENLPSLSFVAPIEHVAPGSYVFGDNDDDDEFEDFLVNEKSNAPAPQDQTPTDLFLSLPDAPTMDPHPEDPAGENTEETEEETEPQPPEPLTV